MPKVSAVIPTYNRRALVHKAIDSVLAQTYRDFELIVVDDGSTDGTENDLKTRYGDLITYIRQENQGESAARNRGIAQARGEYIAFLDSDDLWSPDKLARQVPELDNNPGAAVVFCQAWQIDGNGKKLGQHPLCRNAAATDFTLERLLMFNRIPAGASTCLLRRSALERVGGFADDIHYGDEWDLWLRLAAETEMLFVAEPLAFYRRHRDTQSHSLNIRRVDDALADRLRMLERCFKRYPDRVSMTSYTRAVAHQHFVASMSSYMLGDAERGRRWLRRAFELDSANWSNLRHFAHWVVVFALSYSLDNEGGFSAESCVSFLNTMCANLPALKNAGALARAARARTQTELGLLEYQSGRRSEAITSIAKGLLLDPRLIRLELLAVLAEPLVGQRLVSELRSLRHRDR